jgi:hypothetical protein
MTHAGRAGLAFGTQAGSGQERLIPFGDSASALAGMASEDQRAHAAGSLGPRLVDYLKRDHDSERVLGSFIATPSTLRSVQGGAA